MHANINAKNSWKVIHSQEIPEEEEPQSSD